MVKAVGRGSQDDAIICIKTMPDGMLAFPGHFRLCILVLLSNTTALVVDQSPGRVSSLSLAESHILPVPGRQDMMLVATVLLSYLLGLAATTPLLSQTGSGTCPAMPKLPRQCALPAGLYSRNVWYDEKLTV